MFIKTGWIGRLLGNCFLAVFEFLYVFPSNKTIFIKYFYILDFLLIQCHKYHNVNILLLFQMTSHKLFQFLFFRLLNST